MTVLNGRIMETLQEQRDVLAAKLKTIVARAHSAARDFTAAEVSEASALWVDMDQIDQKIRSVAKSQGDLDRILALGSGDNADAAGSGQRYLALAGPAAKAAASKIATQTREHAVEQGGTKALVPAGAVVTDTPLSPQSPVELGRVVPSLISVIRTIQQSVPVYRYLREVDYAANAAVIPSGGQKPVSSMSLVPIDNALQVIATLSEPVDKFILADNSTLADFVRRALLWAVQQELQDEVLNGDGSAGHFDGLLHVAGTQSQPFVVDPLTSLRAAITALEAVGFEAGVFVLHPDDWAAIETARNASGAFDLQGPINAALRQVWSVPVSTTPDMPKGQALALDRDSVVIRVDSAGIRIDWDGAGPLFQHNQVQARVEGRFSFDVLQPGGVVITDLTATGTLAAKKTTTKATSDAA